MKVRRSLSRAQLTACLMGMFTASLCAGPVTFDSVEWTTCDANLVVLGTISSVKKAASSDGKSQWETVKWDCVMEVSEFIKGSGPSPVAFNAWFNEKPPWQPGQEMLVFLKPAPQTGKQAPPGPLGFLRAINPAQFTNLPSCEMQFVQDREDLLRICRVWSKSPIQGRVSIPIPEDSEMYAVHGGGGVQVCVPAEERIRLHLIEQARSPKQEQRLLAAKLLASFPGPETEAVLTRLMEDPAAQYTFWGNDTPWFAEYPVRAQACKSLETLGRTVPQEIVVRGKVGAEELRRFRREYWSESLFNILPAAWRIESVEEGPSQPVKDERGALVVMRVKCADAQNHCTFTLVPVEWTGPEPWKNAKLLGRMSGGGMGRRLFYVEGQLSQGRLSGAWETRVMEAFKLETVEP